MPKYYFADGSISDEYQDRPLHRVDGPAVTFDDGSTEWWLNGYRHRGNDLPAVEEADGEKQWWVQGKRHRVGGPAHITEYGDRIWYQNDKKHRLDGPAEEDRQGNPIAYWIDDRQVDPFEPLIPEKRKAIETADMDKLNVFLVGSSAERYLAEKRRSALTKLLTPNTASAAAAAKPTPSKVPTAKNSPAVPQKPGLKKTS